ncbi:hypothetical protein HCN51_55085 [Nonomuraea sp. FMUSA5-5]|uniref:Uncharacterized protein n=1 Tax=Nonomuraea composti TaxID=2720023 RepID=A0ABX1BL56_9ACTN|nr:hypothetical protein [Nonomuraea sp. FMUSA5-5]NJP98455.1 hypothetical protein [Nonomuraea sp. FMUSA5-5]
MRALRVGVARFGPFVAVRRLLGISTILVLFSAGALAMVAYGEYEDGNRPFPPFPDPGSIEIWPNDPRQAINVYLDFRPSIHTSNLDILVAPVPENAGVCSGARVVVVNSYLRDVRSNGRSLWTETDQPYEFELPCEPGHGFSLKVTLSETMLKTSGAITVVSLPQVLVASLEAPASSASTILWTVQSAYPGDLKPETVSKTYEPPGLQWRTLISEYDWRYDAPYGIFTSLSAEKAADRSTFWSGLMAGAAVSLLAWAGQLVVDRRQVRRQAQQRQREVSPEVLAGMVGDVVAGRVLASLEERDQMRKAAENRGLWRSFLRLLGSR